VSKKEQVNRKVVVKEWQRKQRKLQRKPQRRKPQRKKPKRKNSITI
jgi:predicted kinase